MKANVKNGWVNLSVLMGKSGKPYAKLDTYEPKEETVAQAAQHSDDLPF